MTLFPAKLQPVCIAVACLVFACGCGRRATITLEQPQARPAQQRLKLASNWAFTGLDGPRRIVQLDFPLPGGVDGPRDFRFYLVIPNSPGWHEVSGSGGVRGFLIQAAPGELHGKSLAVAGRVRLREILTLPQERKLEIDVRFEDGSRIAGTARVVEDDGELRAFRNRYGGDIAALRIQPPDAVLASDGATGEGVETGNQLAGGTGGETTDDNPSETASEASGTTSRRRGGASVDGP